MLLSPLQWILWIVVAFAQIALAIRMIISQSLKQWPSLFFFILTLSLKDVMRIANALTWRSAWFDFYFYWSCSLVAEALEVWMIIQIAQKMLATSVLARRIVSRAIVLMAAIS